MDKRIYIAIGAFVLTVILLVVLLGRKTKEGLHMPTIGFRNQGTQSNHLFNPKTQIIENHWEQMNDNDNQWEKQHKQFRQQYKQMNDNQWEQQYKQFRQQHKQLRQQQTDQMSPKRKEQLTNLLNKLMGITPPHVKSLITRIVKNNTYEPQQVANLLSALVTLPFSPVVIQSQGQLIELFPLRQVNSAQAPEIRVILGNVYQGTQIQMQQMQNSGTYRPHWDVYQSLMDQDQTLSGLQVYLSSMS